jgi:hypothetical protein
LVEKIKTLTFDTLFLPVKPLRAVELFQHLAAQKIWPLADRSRFASDEDIREVLMLGTPEWYSPRVRTMARRYGEHAIFPVVFATESKRGAVFGREIQRDTGRSPTAILAVLHDLVAALEYASRTAVEKRVSARDALKSTQYSAGVTAGFDFSRRDAISSLFMLKLGRGIFVPLSQDGTEDESPKKK